MISTTPTTSGRSGTPEPLDPFAIHPPALGPQQRHPLDQPQLVLGRHPLVALRRAMLADDPARPTLRHPPPPHQETERHRVDAPGSPVSPLQVLQHRKVERLLGQIFFNLADGEQLSHFPRRY